MNTAAVGEAYCDVDMLIKSEACRIARMNHQWRYVDDFI